MVHYEQYSDNLFFCFKFVTFFVLPSFSPFLKQSCIEQHTHYAMALYRHGIFLYLFQINLEVLSCLTTLNKNLYNEALNFIFIIKIVV